LEHIDNISKEAIDLAIPMVCFCDIPLSQIKDHVNTYGEYAIGLSKEWAMSNGISPVFYLHYGSLTNEMINKLFKASYNLDKVNSNIKNELTASNSMNYFQFLFFCKSYNGRMWRNGILEQNKTFYDEREWRFIPNLAELDSLGANMVISKDIHENVQLRNRYNRDIENIKIKFSPKDIKYIIIEKEQERLKMIRIIEQIKGSDYSMDDLKELNSKIISVEQIREDF